MKGPVCPKTDLVRTERQGVEIDLKRRQAIPFITVAPGAIQLPKRPDRSEPSGRNPANRTLPLVLTW